MKQNPTSLWNELKNTMGCILELKEGSTDDGPGIRTVVFLKGCPLDCQWCHSPESRSFLPQLALYRNKCTLCGKCQHLCPQKVHGVEDEHTLEREQCLLCGLCVQNCSYDALEILGQEIQAAELLDKLRRHCIFFYNSGGGVTFSGGEPTGQAEFLLALLIGCKIENIHTALDTCGYISWDRFAPLLEYTDLILYDLKHLDENKHKNLTGVSNKPILTNLCKLKEHNTKVIVRIPLIPQKNDNLEHMHAVGQFLSQKARQHRVELLPYNELAAVKYDWLDLDYKLGEQPGQTRNRLEEIMTVLSSYGLEVNVK
jgi:pyruvate formate lyase activating enzyme